MAIILTLVADPDRLALTDAIVAGVTDAVSGAGGLVAAPHWLGPDQACDLAVTGLEAPRVQGLAEAALAGHPVDLLAQPAAASRRKRVLLADMDSTMVPLETLDEMAADAGLADRVVPITRRAMNGEIDFAEALAERLALFAGQPERLLTQVLARTPLSPGAAVAVRTMRAHGTFCQLISGGFTVFTQHVADVAGFEAHEANELEIEAGRLTGRLIGPVVTKDRKLALLQAMLQRFSVGADTVVAVGDGANDLPMLTAAGLGVAYRAKPTVRAACAARIDHTDLRTLLFYQGYTVAEFTGG